MRDAPPVDMPAMIQAVELMVKAGVAIKHWNAALERWEYEITDPSIVDELLEIRAELAIKADHV